MSTILVTGGAGFIGSHVSEYYAQKGHKVIVLDNLSRATLLKKDDKNALYNWNYLKSLKNVTLIKGDVTQFQDVDSAAQDVDIIIHAAAQTAVTTSVIEPQQDFLTNALGTFNVLEAARKYDIKSLLYCSTNKVYGENVNMVEMTEKEKRYEFTDAEGISEEFSIDHCEHTPYGCSKLTGDLYAQDYGHLYGIKTGVFRMSCIYGTRQFGVEDQGWVAWFTIATMLNKQITIYGDGKQVRDVLYVSDLVDVYDKFLNSSLKRGVFNVGGGLENTMSLLELLDLLHKLTGKKSNVTFSDWRPSDQKVFISNISKAQNVLGWKPKVTPQEGIKKLVEWVQANKKIF